MPPPRVTIVVLTYDGRDLLDVVLPGVLDQDLTDRRVLVVDNGSRDGTPEHLRERWPEVEILVLPDNVGVAAALNRGVAAATGEYVALLNNDLELRSDWLALLVAALDAHPRAASASGKLLRFADRGTFDAAGDWLLWSGAVVNRGHGETDRGQFDTPEPVFAACAGAALYRRSALQRVGPFDERFFAYLEDVDWAARAQLAGLGSWYEPAAVAFHMGGATTQRDRPRYTRMQARNAVLLAAKVMPARALRRRWPLLLAHHLLWLAASVRAGAGRDHLGAWLEAVRMLRAVLTDRREIQAGRVADLDALDALVRRGLPTGASRLGRLGFELATAAERRQAQRRT